MGLALGLVIIALTPAQYAVFSEFSLMQDDLERTYSYVTAWVYSDEMLAEIQAADSSSISLLPNTESGRRSYWQRIVRINRAGDRVRVVVLGGNLENAIRYCKAISGVLASKLGIEILQNSAMSSRLAAPRSEIILPATIGGLLAISWIVSKVSYEKRKQRQRIKAATFIVQGEHDARTRDWIKNAKLRK